MEPKFTLDEVEQILRNLGVDVTCGGCMCVAFTGIGGPHTCRGASADTQDAADADEREDDERARCYERRAGD